MLTKGAIALRDHVKPAKPEGDVPRTQSELARHLGVTPQAVSNWVHGLGTPSVEVLAELERIYGIPMREWAESATPPRRTTAPGRTRKASQRKATGTDGR